jgi:S1-C subfamily serine protease
MARWCLTSQTADVAGLQVGDIVRQVNRRAVHNAVEANRELARTEPGGPVFLLVWRQENEVFVQKRRD